MTATLTRPLPAPARSTRRSAVLYARISENRDRDEVGVQRQINEVTEWCERNDVEIVGTFKDDNLSASKRGMRPGYRSMLQRLASGDVDMVVAWASDRLTRHPMELEELIDVLNGTATDVQSLHGGSYDLRTTEGRMAARVIGAMAKAEVEKLSERVKSKQRENAQAGKHHGGVRPYGYDKLGMDVIESEAVIIREIADRIVRGESIRSITRDLHERNVPTARGGTWTSERVREIVKRPRNVALVPQDDGTYVKALWKPVLDRRTWDRVCAILSDPSRSVLMGQRGRPMKLLTGILRCGVCGTPMKAQARAGGVNAYTCRRPDTPGSTGCGKISIKGDPVEDIVIKAFLARVANLPEHAPDPTDEADDADMRELERIQRELVDLADEHARGDIDKPTYRRDAAAFERRATEVRARISKRVREAAPVALIQDLSTVDAKSWDDYTTEQQRTMLRQMIDHVLVAPAGPDRSRGVFKGERLNIVWNS